MNATLEKTLAIAAKGIACDIPRGFNEAPCHHGICTREQCARCRRADFFYAALDRYNEEKRSELKKVWAGTRERKKSREKNAAEVNRAINAVFLTTLE